MATDGVSGASAAHPAGIPTGGDTRKESELLNRTDTETYQAHENLRADVEYAPTEKVLIPGPVNTLPNEILAHILGYLDVPKSSANLLDEPCLELTQSNTADLKAASWISKQWRRAVFPMLFKHAQFIVPEPKDHRPMLDDQIKPFLDFATRTSLQSIIASFTLVVQDAKLLGNGRKLDRFSSFWLSLFDALDPPEILIIAPVEALGALTACHVALGDAWQFDCPCHYLRLKRPVASKTRQKETGVPSDQNKVISSDHERLATQTDIALGNLDASVSQVSIPIYPSESALDSAGAVVFPPRAEFSTLFQIRPWTNLLLNEGSSIRAYATYEWWQRQSPSV